MIGDILVTMLLVLLAIVALLLVVPLHFRADGAADDDDGIWWRLRVAWGFGFLAVHADGDGAALRLLGIRVARLGGGAKKKKKKKEKKKEKTKKDNPDEDDGEKPRGLLWFLARRRLITAIARRYLRTLHLRGEVEGVIGLADPTETARLYQLMAALDAVVPGVLAVEVDWVEEVVALRGRIGGWVWPLQVAAITAWLFVDRKTWRALFA